MASREADLSEELRNGLSGQKMARSKEMKQTTFYSSQHFSILRKITFSICINKIEMDKKNERLRGKLTRFIRIKNTLFTVNRAIPSCHLIGQEVLTHQNMM